MRLLIPIFLLFSISTFSQKPRLRDYGIEVGVLKPGKHNAITDVAGVKVGHTTLSIGDSIRTGVTAILPHDKGVYQWKVPAAIYIGNGYGKLAGYSQVKELGNIETPIILTNTLSVAAATEALITHTITQPGNENVGSVNSVVGETNDGYLNDIRGRHVKEEHVLAALKNAESGKVAEGNVGAGTGTVCFQYKGGIGTSSRVIPENLGGYTVGVLVQTNFGGVFELNGVPIAKELDNYPRAYTYDVDGSCMMVVMTDAPVDARNLERMAKRAIMGLAKTGGIASNGSGDYVIAVSTAKENLISNNSQSPIMQNSFLKNGAMTPLFLATIEATQEAIYNSLFGAETTVGRDGHEIKALPIDKVLEIMKKHEGLKE
ncbi:DmpA family aminopeptidase [Arcticibacterium luteifluviistationis]|uniref:Aminopeptidase n=1 Tax=Arcticibacterium luteifluviistationis TaxID=1784714 RepID=A0A2Z4GCA0_9BACT|nr:P1 family peptidase [Arcticibacterium luteifluviistationis]AWV98553.1 aminopeptidase [Arcticibacterium luteifluviistationis]